MSAGNQTKIFELFQAGSFSEVISIATKSNITPDTDPVSSKILAASYFRIGNFELALPILITLESAFNDEPEFLSLFAATARRCGDLNKSMELFQKALRIEPENPSINNNYGNLLIDLHKLSDARDIFLHILKNHPDYQDAINNLNRAQSLLTASSNISSANLGDKSKSVLLEDPLLMSFTPDEIEFSQSRYINKKSQQKNILNIDKLPDPSTRNVALDQIKAAKLAIEEGDALLTLKLCSRAFKSIGADARIYEYASDAYLNLSLFHQAELCLLHSLALGGGSLKRYSNLVSFACMRNDYHLASHYLDEVANIDPQSDHLAQLRENVKVQFKQHASFTFSQSWITPSVQKS